MTEADNPSPQERGVFLPKLRAGIVDEVLAELEEAGAVFMAKTLGTIARENSQLATFLLLESTSMEKDMRVDPLTRFNIALAYYEIYSRSARESGRPLMSLKGRFIDKVLMQRCQVQSETIDKSIAETGQNSEEERRFWKRAEEITTSVSASMEPADLKKALWPVRSLHLIFKKAQAGAGRLTVVSQSS